MKTKSRKHGFRRLLCGLTAFATAALMLPMSAMAVVNPETDIDAGTKTITVTAEDGADGIQEAINYIADLADTSLQNWTVSVGSGTYNRFVVVSGLDGLTIEAAEGADVTVNVLDGNVPADVSFNAGNWMDLGGVQLWNSQDVTIEGLTFKIGNRAGYTHHMNAAISNHNEAGVYADNFTISDCTFIGNGNFSGQGNGNVGISISRYSSYIIEDCTFVDLMEGIRGQSDGADVQTVSIANNTFTDCSFAIHQYSGDSVKGNTGTFTFTGNTITGTDSLYNKAYFEDKFAGGSESNGYNIYITNNKLENAIIGLVNLEDNYGSVDDVYSGNNNFGKNTFVVTGQNTTGQIEMHATYKAPEGSKGQWEITGKEDFEVSWSPNPEGASEAIQAAVDKANAEGSTVLKFGVDDPDNFLLTFTWFKDAIYWVTDNTPDPIDPALDKTSNYAQVIGEVAPDAVVPFEVALLAPQTGDVIVTDEMTGMYFNRDSLSVWVNGSRFYDYALDSNYVSFTLTLRGLTIGDRVTLSYSGTVTGNPGDRLVNAVEVENKSDYVTGTVVQPTTGDDNDYTLSIRKEWVGDDPSDRPDSITLNIYKDGELYDELEMSGRRFGDSDTWRESYPIPARYEEADWWVEEADVPAYYDSSVEETRDNVFVITNTYDEPEVVIEESSEPSEPAPEPSQPSEYIPEPSEEPSSEPAPEPQPEPAEPSEPTLPQTGQLWWPVPVLLLCGAVAVASGALRSARRNRK